MNDKQMIENEHVFFYFYCTHFAISDALLISLRDTACTDKPYNICATGFDFESCASASLTDDNPHLSGPSGQGKRRQPVKNGRS